jgi:hypothetical protein
MAQNSFVFKGWAITIAAGLSAFGAADTKHALLVIALVTSIVFWGLDGYYLWLERAFIKLYETVAATDPASVDFAMRPVKSSRGSNWFTRWSWSAWAWFKTCWRPHNCFFYGSIVAVEVIGIFVIKGMK